MLNVFTKRIDPIDHPYVLRVQEHQKVVQDRSPPPTKHINIPFSATYAVLLIFSPFYRPDQFKEASKHKLGREYFQILCDSLPPYSASYRSGCSLTHVWIRKPP